MANRELAAMPVVIGVIGTCLHHLPEQPHAFGHPAEMDLGDAQHALGRDEVGVVLQGLACLLVGGPRIAQQVLQGEPLHGAREVAARIEHDRAVERRDDLLARGVGHGGGLVVGDAEQAKAQHGPRHRIRRRALDGDPQGGDGRAVAVERANEDAGGLVEELRRGQRRVVGAAQAFEELRLDPDADGGGDVEHDLVLQAEDVVELAVVALGPDLRGRAAFLQPERQAQPLAGRLHRALEHEVGAGRIARPHGERRLAGQCIADRVGQALGQRPRLVIAADEADRLQGDHRLLRFGRNREGWSRGHGCGGRAVAGRCLAGGADVPDGDGILDVLELLRAAVDEPDVRQLAADLVVDLGRDADRTRAGNRLETGRDVDAVAVEIVAFDDDVADIDADAELQGPRVGLRVARGDRALAFDGAEHGGNHAGEFGDDRVARRAEDATVVLGDDGIDDLAAGPEAGQRAGLVLAHQPGELMDIGRKDCSQFALDWSHSRRS